MALVNHEQIVFRKEVEQAIRAFPCLSAIEVTAVVFYAGAMAEFLYHLHVILHTLLYSLCFQRVAEVGEKLYPFHEIVLYHAYCRCGLLFGRYEKIGGINLVFVEPRHTVIGH